MAIVIKEIIVKTTIESTRKPTVDEQMIRSIKEQIKEELKEEHFQGNRITVRSKSR